jgi:hypothetical protein
MKSVQKIGLFDRAHYDNYFVLSPVGTAVAAVNVTCDCDHHSLYEQADHSFFVQALLVSQFSRLATLASNGTYSNVRNR